MPLQEITDPELLKLLNGADDSKPTLQERKGEADVNQSQASTENTHESAITERELRPARRRKAEAEATSAEGEATKTTSEVQTKADLRGQTANAFRTVIDKIDQVALDSADNAGWFETGTSGEIARALPSFGANRPAKDLKSNIDTIDANTAFTALSNLRKESPTGGAVGNVSDKDLELLKSTVSNLDPDQSQEQFLTNLAATKKHYLTMLGMIDPKAAGEYAEKAGIRFDKDGGAFLSPINGPDDRKRLDPFGVIGPGSYGPNAGGTGTMPGGGGSGGPGGGSPPSSPDGGGLTVADLVAGHHAPITAGAEPWYKTALHGLAEGTGSIVAGAGDMPGALGGNALGQLWSNLMRKYGYNMPEHYSMGDELRKITGLPANPSWSDSLIRGGTGALTGSLLAKYASALMQPGTGKAVADTLAAQPMRDLAAGTAAGGGAELARSQGAGPVGQVGAALGAGMLGYGGASGVAALAASGKVPTELAELASRYKVNLHPVDAGGPVTKILTGAAKGSPISATPVVNAAKQTQRDLGEAATKLGRETAGGNLPETDQAGEFLRGAAKRYNATTRDIGDTNYKRVWRDPAASVLTIPPRNSLAKLDGLIAKLRSAPDTNAPAINNLLKLRSDLANGMTAENLHSLRSEIRDGIYDGGLRSSRDQARMKEVGQAMTDDMLGYLDQTGMGRTSNAIRKADDYWKRRVEHIDQVLQPIVGKDNGAIGGEQVLQRIESMSRGKFGGNARLDRLLSNMAEPERQQVRGSIIDRLGRVSEGAEGEDAFSATRFLGNWDKMTPQAKRALFGDGELRSHLDNIATLAKGTRSSDKLTRYDPSNFKSLAGNLGVQSWFAASNFPAFLTGVGAQFVTGRMLASPRFAKWLAQAPAAKDPRTALQGLATVGTREPLLHNDIARLLQHMEQSATVSPARVNAEEEKQD